LNQHTQIYKSACRMCHGGCGVLVHVKEDKVVKVVGDPESPLNKGKMCPKGMASIEHLYHPEPLVEIHPQTVKQAEVRDGDWVWIETLRGRIKQKAKVTDGIKPNVVNVQHGWWFPEEAAPEYGLWKSNANVLTSNAPPYDPAMGTYQLRALLCKIYKAGE